MSPGFSSPPNPQEYRLLVWEIVKQIPPGYVATYGQVAALVSLPNGISPLDYRTVGPRWVGGAMSACPSNIPWQRVINSQGKISLGGSAGAEQRALLESEGIVFSEKGRIDLKKYLWSGVHVNSLEEGTL